MRFLIALFLVALLAPAGAAPAEEIDRLIAAYYKDRPAPDATVQALVKIMEESPESPGVPKAFNWLIHHGGVSSGSDYDMDGVFLARLEKHHRDNDGLAGALSAMIGFREEATIAFLERLGDNSQSELVSGTALLALASSFEHDREAIERYDKILEKLIKKHPDLKYGRRDVTAYAKQKLFASKNLRIGKVAPEVEGEDAEGKQFKLSDYRGKVVFFNFWGDW
jgi:hypothetical protein